MSVATRNPFALLDEDERRSPSPSPPSPPPPPPPPTSAKRAKGGPAARGGRYYQRGGSRQNIDRNAPISEDPPITQDAKQRRSDGDRREERRGRGRGSNRGRGRTFDRHSATGKTDSDKKLHNGWGGDDGNTELKVQEAATFDAAAESGGLNEWAPTTDTAGDWGASSQEPAPEQPQDAEKPDTPRRKDRDPEEEDNTLTLDQYFAQQKVDASLLPKLEARKANDGLQETIWDGATRLEKGQDESYFSGKTKSVPKIRIEKKEKVFLEIDAHFERPSRGRGRGDRGEVRARGGRGRGGRGRANGNNASTLDVNVDDETAFPSLS